MSSYTELGAAAPISGFESNWYFDFDYDLASGKDEYFVDFSKFNQIQSTGIYEVDKAGLEVLVLNADFGSIKTGINLQDTGSSYIYDVDFRDVNANDIYGGAFGFGDGGSRATTGITYVKNVYADGESAPLINYGQSNNDFLRSEAGNAPVYVKYATALNFSDSFIDAKAPVYLMNVTFESAHRALRLWPDQEIIIVNSVINVPEGQTLIWLSEGATLKYYNVSWNGQPDPDPSMIDLDGYGDIIKLTENPLPAMSSFFDDEIAMVSFEYSKDGVTWEPIAGASFGSPDRALMGDVRFDVALPDSGEVRAHVLLTDGREMTSGGVAIASLTEPGTLDLADFGPGSYDAGDSSGSDTTTTGGGTTSTSDDTTSTGSDGTSTDRDTTSTGGDTTSTGGGTTSTDGGSTSTDTDVPSPPAPLSADQIDGALDIFILDVETGERILLDSTVNLSAEALAGRDLSIVVEARPGSVLDGLVESVKMTLDEFSRIENHVPYALFGDKGRGDVKGGLTLGNGEHHLKIQLYTEDRAGGTMLGSFDYTLNVSGNTSPGDLGGPEAAPVSLFLADTRTGKMLVEITSGMVLDQADLMNRDVTFVAKLNPDSNVVAGAESIKFDYDDGFIKATENIAPYALFGDRGGTNYKSGDYALADGIHEMTLSVYSGNNGRGDLLYTADVDFLVDLFT